MNAPETFSNHVVTPVAERRKPLPFGNFALSFRHAKHLVLALALLLLAALPRVTWSADELAKPIRFGVTPAILHTQNHLIEDWAKYLGAQLGRPVNFVVRDRYADMLDLLRRQEVDYAWLSDYPYIQVREQVKLLVIPRYRGKPIYWAYLIVPASDKTTTSIEQLKGTIFAYADPNSHTGYLVPRYQIKQAGENPNAFFRKTFFVWSHHSVIEAVATGMVQGGSVDSYVWDTVQRYTPELTAQTRIVGRSTAFAFPPIVARGLIPAADFQAMQKALLNMSADSSGRQILDEFNLDGFTTGSPQLYDPVEKLMHAVVDK